MNKFEIILAKFHRYFRFENAGKLPNSFRDENSIKCVLRYDACESLISED